MDFISKKKEATTQEQSLRGEGEISTDMHLNVNAEKSQSKHEASNALQMILASEESLSIEEVNTIKIDAEMQDGIQAENTSDITEKKLINEIRSSANFDTSDINIISKAEKIIKARDKAAEVKAVLKDAAEYKKKRREEKLGEGEKLSATVMVTKLPAGFEAFEKIHRDLLQDTEASNKEFSQLKNAMQALFNKFNKRACAGKEYAYSKEFFALRDATIKYLDTHKGHRFSKKGKRRQSLASDLKEKLDNILIENKTLLEMRIDRIENSKEVYSRENDKILLDVGKLQLKASGIATEDRIKKLTPEMVRIGRVIRREKQCSEIIAKKLGKPFNPETGMDGRCLIHGAEKLFNFNSDGTPASEEDARLMDKNIAFAEAFLDEDKTKRHKYLDEIIGKLLSIPIESDYFRPEKVQKAYGKYREMSLLMINYQNIFEADTYNMEYLQHQPECVQKKLASLADVNAAFTYMIGEMAEQNGVKVSDGTYKFGEAYNSQRIEKMDEFDVILADQNNTLYVDQSSTQHLYDEYVKKAMKGKNMVECEAVREQICKAKIDEDQKEEILNQFNDNVFQDKYYCLDNSPVSLLCGVHNYYYQYIEERKNIVQTAGLEKERHMIFDSICAHMSVESEREEYESKLKEFYLWNYSSESAFIKDEKILKAAMTLAVRRAAQAKLFNNYARKEEIDLTDGDVERLIIGVLKPVLFDANGNPANEVAKQNNAWNNKYLNAYADQNMDAMQECIKDILDKIKEFPVERTLDNEYMIEHMDMVGEFNSLILRYSNLKGKFPQIFDEIKTKDTKEYDKIDSLVTFLTAWSSKFGFEIAEDCGLSVDTNNGLRKSSYVQADQEDSARFRTFYNDSLFDMAESIGIKVPGLVRIEEKKNDN